jgi:hypothetical protein
MNPEIRTPKRMAKKAPRGKSKKPLPGVNVVNAVLREGKEERFHWNLPRNPRLHLVSTTNSRKTSFPR